MTCPSPDYCGVNGCSNSACHPSRPAGNWYGWRSRRMTERGDWAGAVISASTGQVLETFPTLGEAAMQAARWNVEPSQRWAALAAAVPDRPEMYETPRGIGRAMLAGAAAGLAGFAVLVALAVMLS